MEYSKVDIQIPPHNIDTERAFLGSVILLGGLGVYNKLSSKIFYDLKHQQIFSAMLSLTQEDKPIDILTLSSKLVGFDTSYLAELVSFVPTHHNIEQYAKIIKEKSLRRSLLSLTDKIRETCNDESTNIYDVIDRTEKSLGIVQDMAVVDDKTEEERRRAKVLKEAMNSEGEEKVVSFNMIAEDMKNGETIPRFMTTWAKLDELLKGFKPKHLIVLSGITKHGKTTFAMDMITRMKDLNPLLLALEEPIEELLEKFVERGEPVPHGYSPRYATKVKTNWIEKRVAEGVENYGSKIVFVDNLRWVKSVDSSNNANDSQKIADTMQELKTIAKRYGVCIVLLVHVNKNAKADMVPTFEDFTGSSDIAQLCDKAIIIWRETKRGHSGELEVTNNTNVSVQLNRQGGVGLVRMVFDNGHYQEYDWHIQDDDLDELAESGKTNKIF